MAGASTKRDVGTSTASVPAPQNGAVTAAVAPGDPIEKDKVLPLPRWLTRVYFIFPIVLYVPDAIFNFYVYTDGVSTKETNPALQVGFFALWAFVSLGVVGMAYLLSVLAPWHWGQGHRIKAFFASLGVVVATGITTWNSLAYRSTSFVSFKTDDWIWSAFPQLKAHGISVTMVLVAIAPPFWGLFWAIVQPTETGRSLQQIHESHAEKLLRTQQEAELKALKAEANAKVRAAQLRGMAVTAAAAREQAKGLFGKKDEGAADAPAEGEPAAEGGEAPVASGADESPQDSGGAHKVIPYPAAQQQGREPATAGTRGGVVMYNHAAAATPTVHTAPSGATTPGMAQNALFGADVQGSAGVPSADAAVTFTPSSRRAPSYYRDELTASAQPYEMSDAEAMTGTSGPRRAVRKPNEPGMLTRTLNTAKDGIPPAIEDAIKAVSSELRQQGGQKPPTIKDVSEALARKANMDIASAQKYVRRYKERGGRAND